MFSEASPIRVVLLADDPLVRAGLATALEMDGGISIVAQFPKSEFDSDKFDLLSVDIALIDEGWSETDESLLASNFELEMPMLYLIDPSVLDRHPGMPAYSMISREAPAEAIRAAIYAVLAGWLVFDPLVPARHSGSQEQALLGDLTDREREVLLLVAKGMTNRAISVALEISENTVKYHVNSILSKLGAQSRTEAVVIAARAGLIPL
ncbi:MAG: response regulator transcription factor [Anaerolineales bacterium]|jgi:DNA-binding NarL/FixJ family response regulator